MVLVSNINVDNGVQAITLTAVVGIDMVESITYDNVTELITFATRPSLLINFAEFLSFSDQVNIFQTAILFNFSSVNAAATKPFDKITSTEFHDIGAGNWDFTVNSLSGEDIVSYEATKSTLKFLMNPRDSDINITFPEWVLFLQAFNHFKLSVKAF